MIDKELTYYEEEVNGHRFRMVSLPGGVFEMGDPEGISFIKATPVHKVEVSAFHIGEFPVTQALWKAVMNGESPSGFKGDQRPVERVSWSDIVVGTEEHHSFLQRLNELTISSRPKNMAYRLPTEAEWEYAARANTAHLYAGSDLLKEVAWNSQNSHKETKEVGLKKANGFGLFDMSGNVWEWCEDEGNPDFYQECSDQGIVKDPISRSGGYRVLRGGSWDDYPQYCRVSYRLDYGPASRYDYIGFRLVLAPSSAG